mgnify:CR=1 FL=1
MALLPVLAGISTGLSALSGLFGGGNKQTSTFQMSPEQKAFLDKLLGEYPVEVQQAILQRAYAPQIAQRFRSIREMTAPLGSAQQVQGQLQTQSDVQSELYQAALGGQQNVRGGILSLLGRGGTQEQTTQQPFAEKTQESLGGIAQILAFLAGLKGTK